MVKKLLAAVVVSFVSVSVYAGEAVVGLGYGMLQTPSLEGLSGATKGGVGLALQYLVSDGDVKYGGEIGTMPIYNYKDAFGNEISLNAIPIMGVVKYGLESSGDVKPYLLGGLGLCYTTAKVAIGVLGVSASESKTYLGLALGGGIQTKISDKTDLDISLRYNRINADEAVSTISLGAGVAFGM